MLSPRLPPASISPEPSAMPVADESAIREPRLWRERGWTARIVRCTDGEGWSVEMTVDDEQEPALVGPWPAGREPEQPRAMDASAFNALLKEASEMRLRHERQLKALLHRRLSVFALDQEWEITLDVVPDEYEPHAILSAIDAEGVTVAKQRVEAEFRLGTASALRWIMDGFRRGNQPDI